MRTAGGTSSVRIIGVDSSQRDNGSALFAPRRAYVAENVVQAAAGWAIGIPLGWLLPWGLARLTLIIRELQISTVFDAATAFLVLAITVALAGLVALFPVRRTVCTSPGDALRCV